MHSAKILSLLAKSYYPRMDERDKLTRASAGKSHETAVRLMIYDLVLYGTVTMIQLL